MTALARPDTGGPGPALPNALRLAVRDLRGGLGGYWIFLLCIALGVAAIAGVGSISGSLSEGLAREGRTILGGDAAISSVSQPIPRTVLDAMAARGRVSNVITTRAMARRQDGAPTLIDVKAVDGLYPLSGSVDLEPRQALDTALAERDGAWGVAAEDTVAAKLDLHIGDRLTIGTGTFELRALLKAEPDRLAGGIAFAPRVMMSAAALEAAGLMQAGSLARWTARVDLGGPEATDEEALRRFVSGIKAAVPEAGLEIKTRMAVSPEFDRNLGRFTQFLTLVGPTALVVGGVGVANAVQAAIERKRESLATLKALGAPGSAVFTMGLVQVLLVASIGIAAGLVIGAALPFGVASGFGALIPFPLVPSLQPRVLALGAVYGVLTTLVFSLGALGRSHDIPVSALFRGTASPEATQLRLPYRLALGLSLLGLIGVAVGFSADHRLAAAYVVATLGAFMLLRLVALGVAALAKALPHPRSVELRLALANLHRPGALTPAVVLSLGLGLTLLVALSLIDDNIHRQVDQGRPGVTPSFFFVDIPSRQAEDLAAFVKARAPRVLLDEVPMMRGRIVRVNGIAAEQVKPAEGAAWVLEGDRGITYAEAVPAGSSVVAGEWWPKDYRGAPLVSFDRELAEGLGLKIGQSVSVNVLGRTVTAQISNLRKVDWQSMGINFVMMFSPNTFAGAPHMVLATAAFPNGTDGAEDLLLSKSVTTAFPTLTIVRVKDVIEALGALLNKLAVTIRAASAITITASVLVLAGALAAGRRARIHDAVVLKVLGATRRQLILAFVLEYAMLGLATALFGIAAGALSAYAVVEHVMHFDFRFTWTPALVATGAALAVTVGLGLLGTWRILGLRPSPYLREP